MKKTERRAHSRKRVIFGAQASAGKGAKLDCVVRNFSEGGACVELKDTHKLADKIALTIPRKGRKYAVNVIWSHENAAGVAFQSHSPSIAPDSATENNELEHRLRVSERKLRNLKRRVKELSGES